MGDYGRKADSDNGDDRGLDNGDIVDDRGLDNGDKVDDSGLDNDIVVDDSGLDSKVENDDQADQGEQYTVAEKIGHGHAFDKHSHQFPEIQNQDDLSTFVKDVVEKNEPKVLRQDRMAYWDETSGAVVIVDPHHHDKGTVFKPDKGKTYFDEL